MPHISSSYCCLLKLRPDFRDRLNSGSIVGIERSVYSVHFEYFRYSRFTFTLFRTERSYAVFQISEICACIYSFVYWRKNVHQRVRTSIRLRHSHRHICFTGCHYCVSYHFDISLCVGRKSPQKELNCTAVIKHSERKLRKFSAYLTRWMIYVICVLLFPKIVCVYFLKNSPKIINTAIL